MISQQIVDNLDKIRSGMTWSPLLVTEYQACEIFSHIFHEEIATLDELVERALIDFWYYDCADRSKKWSEHYRVEFIKKHVEKLYQKTSSDISLALFRNIDALTASGENKSENALLHFFEDVPPWLAIIVTSTRPQIIIPTLQSRMIMLAPNAQHTHENPFREAVNNFLRGDHSALFSLTLGPSSETKFSREDALWIISGLQEAIMYGTLSPRHAQRIQKTRVLLESTPTNPKYLIDLLLFSFPCTNI